MKSKMMQYLVKCTMEYANAHDDNMVLMEIVKESVDEKYGVGKAYVIAETGNRPYIAVHNNVEWADILKYIAAKIEKEGYAPSHHELPGADCQHTQASYYYQKEGQPLFQVLMFIPVEGDEPLECACRMVQTGTKTVPVYQMKCD